MTATIRCQQTFEKGIFCEKAGIRWNCKSSWSGTHQWSEPLGLGDLTCFTWSACFLLTEDENIIHKLSC